MSDLTIVDLINKYVRSELLVLIPVLYIIAKVMDQSKIQNKYIPVILMVISVICSGVYTFSTVEIPNYRGILFAIFTSFVQGIILSGGAIFSGILMQSSMLKKTPDESQSNEDSIKK